MRVEIVQGRNVATPDDAQPDDWMALVDGRVVASVSGTRLGPHVYSVEEVRCPSGSPGWLGALLRHVRDAHDGATLQIACWESEGATNAALRRLGLAPRGRAVVVERSLIGFQTPHRDPFEWVALHRVSPTDLAQALAIAADTSHPWTQSPEGFYAELEAAPVASPELWSVVRHDGAVCGVALGEVDAESGDALFRLFGLTSPYRGRGWGHVLHSLALQRLRDAGAETYVGETLEDNLGMRAVFRRSGCVELGWKRLWELPREAEVG